MQPISFSMLRTFLFTVVNIGCCTYLACLFLSSRSSVATYPWRYFCSSLKVPTVWSNVLEKRHRHISKWTTGMLADSKSELRSLIAIEHGEITNEFLWENVWKKKMLTPAEMYQSTALFFIIDWRLCSESLSGEQKHVFYNLLGIILNLNTHSLSMTRHSTPFSSAMILADLTSSLKEMWITCTQKLRQLYILQLFSLWIWHYEAISTSAHIMLLCVFSVNTKLETFLNHSDKQFTKV